jgi:phosphoribosylaminoimidazole (AIR) synthetase
MCCRRTRVRVRVVLREHYGIGIRLIVFEVRDVVVAGARTCLDVTCGRLASFML